MRGAQVRDQIGLQEAPLSTILCSVNNTRTRSRLQRFLMDSQEGSGLNEAERVGFVHAG